MRAQGWGGQGPGSPGSRQNTRVPADLSVGGRRARGGRADGTLPRSAAGELAVGPAEPAARFRSRGAGPAGRGLRAPRGGATL